MEFVSITYLIIWAFFALRIRVTILDSPFLAA